MPDVKEFVKIEAGQRRVGEIAKFSCTTGRYLVGNSTRQCLSTGLWSGRNPQCKRELIEKKMKHSEL
jgi:hypothetical protein